MNFPYEVTLRLSQGQRPRDEGGCSAVLSAQRRIQDRVWLFRRSPQVRLERSTSLTTSEGFVFHWGRLACFKGIDSAKSICSLRRTAESFCLLHSIIGLVFVGSAVKIRPKEGDVYFDVVAVVDPVTRDAQKLAPLLSVGLDSVIGLDEPSLSVQLTTVLCPIANLFPLYHVSVFHSEGSEAARKRQPEGFHELPVETVRYASKKVKNTTDFFLCFYV